MSEVRRLASTIGRFARWSLILGFLLLLVACYEESEPLSEPITQTPLGRYVHPGSQIEFPESVGDFVRFEVAQFDVSGDNVSVGYNLEPPDPIAATVYVYPGRHVVSIGSPPEVVAAAKELLDQRAFEASWSEVLSVHPEATVISEDENVHLSNPDEKAGRKATFEAQGLIAGRPQILRSDLYVFGFRDWFVKYRFTYSSESPTAPAHIREFMDSLQWPEE